MGVGTVGSVVVDDGYRSARRWPPNNSNSQARPGSRTASSLPSSFWANESLPIVAAGVEVEAGREGKSLLNLSKTYLR